MSCAMLVWGTRCFIEGVGGIEIAHEAKCVIWLVSGSHYSAEEKAILKFFDHVLVERFLKIDDIIKLEITEYWPDVEI